MKRFKKRNYSRSRRFRRRITKNFRRKVKTVINRQLEKKYYDYIAPDSISIQSGTDATLLSLLQPIEIGTSVSQRIGNEIFLRYILINIDLNANTVEDAYVRIVVCQARTNGLSTASFPGNIFNFLDREKFRIIKYDKVWNLSNLKENAANKKFVRIKVRFMKKIQYDQGTGSPFLPWYLYLTSNDAVIPSPLAYITWRAYYTDS